MSSSNVGRRIIERLQDFNDALQRGDLSAYDITTMNRDDLRNYLKLKGWHQHNKIKYGKEYEYWRKSWNGVGFSPTPMGLDTAVKRQLKLDGYIIK